MSDRDDRLRAWTESPFFVLGLPPDAPRPEVERAAQKLLAELALGRGTATTYATPLGPRTRTADLVRAALAELRDPRKRLLHELRARMPVGELPVRRALVPDVLGALGWRSR